jgi:hypothetical protein
MKNKTSKEYLVIAQFVSGPLAGNTMQIETLKYHKFGTVVTEGEHKFLVLECNENPLG